MNLRKNNTVSRNSVNTKKNLVFVKYSLQTGKRTDDYELCQKYESVSDVKFSLYTDIVVHSCEI